jgi:insulysin
MAGENHSSTSPQPHSEVNAVNSEHNKNLDNDYWRLHQLDCSTSDPNHPYSLFSTGSIDTLWHKPRAAGIDTREELLKFHRQHYSASIITVAIYGR